MEAILNLSEVRTKRENWTYLAGFSSAIRFEKDSVIFDGKAISIYNAKDNVYATAAKEGTLDDAIKYAVVDLGLRVPLAMMFLSTFPDELEARVTAADYVETRRKASISRNGLPKAASRYQGASLSLTRTRRVSLNFGRISPHGI